MNDRGAKGNETYELVQPISGFSHLGLMSKSRRHLVHCSLPDCMAVRAGLKILTERPCAISGGTPEMRSMLRGTTTASAMGGFLTDSIAATLLFIIGRGQVTSHSPTRLFVFFERASPGALRRRNATTV